MGPLTLPQGLESLDEPLACLITLGIAAPCCGFIASGRLGQGHLSSNRAVLWQGMMDGFSSAAGELNRAGIMEDDIPGSLGIPLRAQPLPARGQCLPKIMNPAEHTWWHPPLASPRKDQRAELALQIKMIEPVEEALE